MPNICLLTTDLLFLTVLGKRSADSLLSYWLLKVCYTEVVCKLFFKLAALLARLGSLVALFML